MDFPPLTGEFGPWLKQVRKTVLNMTQEQFATHLAIDVTTIQSYEQRKIFPSKEAAEEIARFIGYPDVDAFVHFARHGRYFGPPKRLKHKSPEPDLINSELIEEIRAEHWPIAIEERFRNNSNRWGLGVKDDGTGLIHRVMLNGAYLLTLIPRHPHGCFLGGDSAIVAPETFYLTVEIEKLEGAYNSSGGIAFEELHDNHLALFHARNDEQLFAVADTRAGGLHTRRVIPWQPRPDVIRARRMNKFGLLGEGERFTFFINDVRVGTGQIERTPGTRLDLVIGGLPSEQQAVYLYQNFILRVPSAE